MQQEKFRVVYDGSAKFEQHLINAEFFSSPDLLVPLFDVITRFRMGKYAIIADLKECFFQIGIPPEQRDFFRIVGYVEDDFNRELEIWRFAIHVWGMASSPFIATRRIRQIATENRTDALALTTSAIKKNKYVDDLLKSHDTIEEAKMLYRESTELFADSGFKLTKWSINAAEIMQNVPHATRAPSLRLIAT